MSKPARNLSETTRCHIHEKVQTKCRRFHAEFWVVTQSSVVVGYQRYQKFTEAARTSEMLVSHRKTAQRHNPEELHVTHKTQKGFKLGKVTKLRLS